MTAAGPPAPPVRPGMPGRAVLADRRPGPWRLAGFVLLLLGAAAGLAVFSAFPWVASPPEAAVLKIAFKHVAAPAEAGRTLSREELERLPRHMRPETGQGARSRSRRDTTLRVAVDGRAVLERTYRPSGLRGDGPTFVYEELALSPGPHRLEATLTEGGPIRAGGDGAAPPERRIMAAVEVREGEVLLLELASGRELTLRGGRRPGPPGPP